MMRVLLILAVLFINIPAFAYIVTTNPSGRYGGYYPKTYSSSSGFQRYMPISAQNYVDPNIYYNQPRKYNNKYYQRYFSENNIGALEKYAFNKSYRRDDPISRLERLENLAFGAVQCGDIAARYKNVENAILSRPKNNYKRSVLGNVVNYLGGQLTGYTPSINSDWDSIYPNQGYYPYSPSGYGNTRVEQFSNGIFGGGYNVMNSGFCNGSSVRILD